MTRRPSGYNPRGEATPFRAAREGDDFALHEWRRKPRRHLRSEARAGQIRRAAADGKGDIVVRQGNPGPLMPSPFEFRKYGQCGIDVSELFPRWPRTSTRWRCCGRSTGNRTTSAGDLRTEHGKDPDGATQCRLLGDVGLGSENQSLPAFVVIYDIRRAFGRTGQLEFRFHARGISGHGVSFVSGPIIDLKPPSSVSPEQQRARLDLLSKLNEMDAQRYPGNTELSARWHPMNLLTACRDARPRLST